MAEHVEPFLTPAAEEAEQLAASFVREGAHAGDALVTESFEGRQGHLDGALLLRRRHASVGNGSSVHRRQRGPEVVREDRRIVEGGGERDEEDRELRLPDDALELLIALDDRSARGPPVQVVDVVGARPLLGVD